VVFGMPKEAIARGGAERIVPLNKMAETLIGFARS
jgi:chemotaxis response regulator CheB